MIKELVTRSRSYRRFDQSARIAPETLRELCDLMRLSPSGRNAQPLKYMTVTSEEVCSRIFPTLAWAGYLKDWDGPEEGERPAAYVVILGDTKIANNYGIDAGLSIQSLLLGAVEQGLGGCIIQSIRREDLAQVLDVPEGFEILYVIALGKPVEKVVIEPLPASGDIKYWHDAENVHHVPKRALEDLIIAEK